MQIKRILLLTVILALAVITTVNAQTKIKDGTVTGSSNLPNSNSILELESNNKGLLLPRVALTMTTNPSPLSAHVKGIEVYNTAEVNDVDSGLYFNDGTKWVRLSSSVDSATAWLLHGNTGTNAGTDLVGNAVDGNYVGTTDAENMVISTNGIKRMIFDTLSNAWGGKNNVISNATTQDLDHGGYPASSFMWGINNTDSSYLNTVFGTNNKITGNLHSNIITGEQDTIGGFWGWGNAMFGVNNSLTVQNGGGNIIGGIQNRRIGNAVSSGNGGALFGYQNIDSSYFGSIVGGSGNTLGTGGGNSVVGGLLNTISTPSFQAWNQGMASSNAVFGSSNTILSSTSSSNANLNFVSGGSNKLTDGNYSAIFGFSNIDSANNSLVAGVGNIVTTSMQDATVVGTFNQPVAGTLLAVGNGTSSSTQSNAITVTNTPASATATSNSSTLNVNGSMSASVNAVTSAYTFTASDYLVIYTGASNVNFTLPDPATCKGRIYRVLNFGANAGNDVFVIFNYNIRYQNDFGTPNSGTSNLLFSSQTVASGTSMGSTLSTQGLGNEVTIISDGTQWVRAGI